MRLDRETGEALVLGGAVLGGGGGGALAHGRDLIDLAVRSGRPEIIPLDRLDPSAGVVTVSGVGAPAATQQDLTAGDALASLELLTANHDGPVDGMVTSENGGFSSANGLVQSALSGLPVIDAPCDGRAHPTGVMGSIGLERLARFVSRQAAVGGTPGARRVELYVEGSLRSVDHVIREASVAAGGLIAVTRNPVSAAYLREHAAPGALELAIRIGRALLEASGGGRVAAERVIELLGGAILDIGPVTALALETRGGYDVGRLRAGAMDLTFWNEYMSADAAGVRRATFPDLIFTVDARDGTPLSTAELTDGREVVVAYAPASSIPLGAGVRSRTNLVAVERALGVEIVKHATIPLDAGSDFDDQASH